MSEIISKAQQNWIKNSLSHDLYYPSGIQASHEARDSFPLLISFLDLKDLLLLPPVFFGCLKFKRNKGKHMKQFLK